MADHKSRSRSPAPARDRDGPSRHRSRSPRRRDDRDRDRDRNRDRRDRPRGNNSGFKWKEKRSRDDDRGGEKRSERGYRNRSRSPRRERERKPESRSTGTGTGASVEDKFGVADKFGPSKADDKENTDKPPEKAAAAASVQIADEPMIIVHVNDRLGTKATIPCLASDPIKLFKAQVAARIGRQPHEILLKRQGERPFKDQLTLADYGVSNGVQIDLEIDTGE